MKKYFLFSFICSALVGIGQTSEQSFMANLNFAPSPNATALGKYGDVPVSLYTGVPKIGIPFYTIQEGNLSVPISLSYHSQGFKVDQIASDVGLGWSLNAGGVITRAVKGVPDDFNGELWGIEDSPWVWQSVSCAVSDESVAKLPSYGFLMMGNEINDAYSDPEYATSTTGGSCAYGSLNVGIAKGGYDGEPDLFYYNFGEFSGQFVFDKNGVPKLFSKENLEITYTRNTGGDLIKFQVIDGNGNTYFFEAIETSTLKIISSTVVGEYVSYFNDEDNLSHYDGDKRTLPTYNSSWYLTKIKNANSNHEINFSYTNETQSYVSDFGTAFKIQPDGIYEKYTTFSCVAYSITAKKISEISWSQGKINFVYNFLRDDIGCPIFFQFPSSINYALSTISISSLPNSELKRYNFSYDHFNSSVNHFCSYRRLKLLSVKEYDATLNLFKPPYLFEYNTTLPIVGRSSVKRDYWGFMKITEPPLFPNYVSTRNMVPQVYSYSCIDNYSKSNYSVFQRNSCNTNENILSGYSMHPEANGMLTTMINKITYPTSGYTLFEYEPHVFYMDGANKMGGGVRIKKITDYDGIEVNRNIIKNYSYLNPSDNTKSSGVVLNLPVLAHFTGATSGLVRYTNSIANLGTTQGSFVGYSSVDVEYNGNGKTRSFFNVNGSLGNNTDECIVPGNCIYNASVSYVDNTNSNSLNSFTNYDNFPFADNPNYDWYRGVVEKEEVYDNSNRLVKKTLNEYTVKNHEKILALKVTVAKTYQFGFDNYGAPTSNYRPVYKYAKHYMLSGWKVLSKQTTIEYDVLNAGRQLQTVVNYFYDNTDHLQLTKTTSTNSKGQTFETIYKRSKDYPGAAGMVTDLNTQHRLNEVIESQTWLQGSPKKLLGASFNSYFDYKTQNGLATPQNLVQQQFQLETAAPLAQTNFVETWFDDGTPVLDQKYKPTSIVNYDNKDNLTRQSIINGDKQNHTANILGHSKSMVIAQVNNATEADCGFTSFESDDQNLWAMGGTVLLNTTDRHTGTSCRTIPANTFGPTRNYMPSNDFQNSKFIMSCWVKTNSNLAGAVGSLVLTSVQNISSGSTYPNVAGSYVSTSINNTNNIWKYIEVEIDLKLIKANGLIPNTALALRSFVWNTHGSIAIQVDDIRFYPKQARMASYTHIPLIGVSSISDENSNCQYYEYDTFGRLKIVKDQNGKILEKTDYNYKP